MKIPATLNVEEELIPRLDRISLPAAIRCFLDKRKARATHEGRLMSKVSHKFLAQLCLELYVAKEENFCQCFHQLNTDEVIIDPWFHVCRIRWDHRITHHKAAVG
ncbi:hypothetical protein T07_7445 [Trichinella nelsoni]|uniref:Uncharacterized protein n=1 Tax=Trichinella nelsoni TaxID=6336 RepID=A0A0V0SAE7_9BILA|nr:hypothetical protein T07_7445 [Trichinella nelsoni]